MRLSSSSAVTSICALDFFSTQEHTVAVIAHDESADVFSWKGDSLEEYWDYILNTLI